MANVGNKQLGEFLRHQAQETVERDRDAQATITAIANWPTTGELKCTLLNGDVIWVDAGGNLQELAVGDVIWVRKFGVGQRSQYRMVGFFKQAGGTRAPASVRSDVIANTKISKLWASDGTPQAVHCDADGNVGIGTTTITAGARLQVKAAGDHTRFLIGDSTVDKYAQFTFQNLGGDWTVAETNAAGGNALQFIRGITTVLAALPDGTIGIGTGAPGCKFDVVGEIRSRQADSSIIVYINTFTPAGGTGGIGTYTEHPLALTAGAAGYVQIDVDGVMGIDTTTPTLSDGSGMHIAGKLLRIETAKTPASAGATGLAGEICWDASYIYVCIATNTWRRVAHATW